MNNTPPEGYQIVQSKVHGPYSPRYTFLTAEQQSKKEGPSLAERADRLYGTADIACAGAWKHYHVQSLRDYDAWEPVTPTPPSPLVEVDNKCKACGRTCIGMRDPDGRGWLQRITSKVVDGKSSYDTDNSGIWCPDCAEKLGYVELGRPTKS